MQDLSALINRLGTDQEMALSGIVRQYVACPDSGRLKENDKKDNFLTPYLSGDQETTLKLLSQILDGLFERPTRPPLSNMTMLIACELATDKYPDDDHDAMLKNSEKLISFWKGFDLRKYPDIHEQKDITDHYKYRRIPRRKRFVIDQCFEDWQSEIELCKKEICTFTENCRILGFDIDQIALKTRSYNHYPDKNVFMNALDSVLRGSPSGKHPSPSVQLS